MAEAEVMVLKEALFKQAQFIRELSDELDKERKAAASGADEALSMIFRLQEGRAMQKMEAIQFKRIAEEKMLHTEELLAFLKESMLEKEGVISTLKFQLQSCRQNMQRYGICDIDVEEINVPTIWSDTCECSKKKTEQRIEFLSNNSVIEEVVFDSEEPKTFATDNASQPDTRIDNICARDNYRNRLLYSKSNPESLFELNSESIEEVAFNLEVPKPDAMGNASKPNMSVDNLFVRDDTGNCSVCSQSIAESISESSSGCARINSRCRSSLCLSRCASRSSSIQDIYEVPKNVNSSSDPCNATLESKTRTCKGSPVNDFSHMTPILMQNEWKYSNLEKRVSMNSLQSDFEQLKRQVKKIENDQKIMREEDSKRNDEQLMLLREMHEQLKSIQSQTKVPKKKKISKQDEILLASIAEAIMLFSL